MLKILVLKIFIKYINIYIYINTNWVFFGRDDAKQEKKPIFIIVPQVKQVPKVQKKKAKSDVRCY